MRILKHPSGLLIIFAVAACASSGRSDGGVRRDRNVITNAELISGVLDATVYDAVERLRPQWLRARGRVGSAPRVIWDNQPYQLDILRNMQPQDIDTLRFISAADATTRWGLGYPSGAIEVVSRRRR